MKYKRIKGVAHNLGHSFLSILNGVDEGGRYTVVPRAIFTAAAAARVPEVRIDVLGRRIDPASLMSAPVREGLAIYHRTLPRLLETQNVEPAAVTGATITLALDHTRSRPAPYDPGERVPEFTCLVEITDDRGVAHRATPTRW